MERLHHVLDRIGIQCGVFRPPTWHRWLPRKENNRVGPRHLNDVVRRSGWHSELFLRFVDINGLHMFSWAPCISKTQARAVY